MEARVDHEEFSEPPAIDELWEERQGPSGQNESAEGPDEPRLRDEETLGKSATRKR
jgi:hypothetical protein